MTDEDIVEEQLTSEDQIKEKAVEEDSGDLPRSDSAETVALDIDKDRLENALDFVEFVNLVSPEKISESFSDPPDLEMKATETDAVDTFFPTHQDSDDANLSLEANEEHTSNPGINYWKG